MYTITSEQVVGSYAVRYKTLTQLVNAEYAGSNATTINIFVDLTSILKGITSQPIQCNSPYSIVASIINLCAHYRNFFREYYNVHTRFFIIGSNVDATSINAKYIPTYNRVYAGNNPAINSIVDQALAYLNILCPYIEDFSFYFTEFEFGVFVYDILQYEARKNNIFPGLIITKDPYNFQLVSDDAFMVKILRPRKENNDDTSFIVNHNNAINIMCSVRKVNPIINNLNPALLSLIYSLTRVPERNVPSLYRIPNVIKALNNAVNRKVILNDRSGDINYVCKILNDSSLLVISDTQKVCDRFKAIDIELQHNTFNYMASTKYNGIVNLYDPKAFKEISVKYFKDYPLDLNAL